MIRTPVAITKPERHRQVQRDQEEDPHHQEVLKEEHDQPAAELLVAQQLRIDERLLAARDHARLPMQKRPDQHEPGHHQPRHGRHPEPLGRSRLRYHPTPGTRLEHAEDEHAKAGGAKQRADRSIFGRRSGGASSARRASTRMTNTSMTSPAKTQRQDA